MSGLERVFAPRRVAVVGASEEPGKIGAAFMANLEGFEGELIPVTPSREEVAGRRAYPRLTDVPGTVDLAVAVVPAKALEGVAADAAEAGVGGLVVISGGFAEIGEEGAELQRRVVEAARAGGVRVVGPNCLGVQNCHTGLNATMALGGAGGGGRISLATQSGAYGMAVHMLAAEQQMSFAKVYAAGNKSDIADSEVLEYFGADPDSAVLCFFMESLQDGRRFCEVAREVAPRKPILVTKTGRSEEGARAAVSHTAALAGEADVWRAGFAQAGVVLADSGLEMMDAAKALDWQPLPRGPRVGIVTNSGGTGVELTDLLAEQGLTVPELSTGLRERLAASLPAFGSARNPVDVTTAWKLFGELYPLAVEELARSGEVDQVVPVLLQRSAQSEDVVAGLLEVAERLAADGIEVPIYACWVAPADARANADRLQAGGIPCFEWPARTARAAALAVRCGEVREHPPQAPPVPVRRAGGPAIGPGLLDPDRGAELLRAYGVEVAPQRLAADPEEAAALAAELGFPAVAKLVSPGLAHKSDVGGVRVGLADPEEVRAAAAELLAIDSAGAVLIQPLVTGVEVIVGGFRDPQFGPVVAVGLGGVLVEVLRDVAFRLAPVTEAEALEALRSLRGVAVLEGTRGQEGVDLGALARTVAAASELLASEPEVAELDLNPVLASPRGAVAVDVRVVGGGEVAAATPA